MINQENMNSLFQPDSEKSYVTTYENYRKEFSNSGSVNIDQSDNNGIKYQ